VIYPGNFEEIIGFDQLRSMLASLCRYDSAKLSIAEFQLLKTKPEIMALFDETDEWNLLQQLHPTAANAHASDDITAWLQSLQIENFFFDEEELAAVYQVTEAYVVLHQTLKKNAEAFPLLTQRSGNPEGIAEVRRIIAATIDNKSKLLPYASAAYGKITAEIEKLEKTARDSVQQVFKKWKNAGFTAETDITVRDERLVIPVLAENKRKVQGFVKDVSATGKIIYVEPLESLELNNRLTELYADKRREREKILKSVAAQLRPHSEGLRQSMQVLTAFDVIQARYALSQRLQAQRPLVEDKPVLFLKKGLNPLLWLKFKGQKNAVVPMDLELSAEHRIAIISGPNAGGKSISLKTAILLQYMAQCGLFIPALPESIVGVFYIISVDCGDGQSLEDGLSTFSAHLQHLKKMTTIASPRSLFAIDELGDGTDPRFGGPIAQVVLESFLQSGALGVVTTHYSRLKEWAGHTEGVLNASMAYDSKELKPLYTLISGKPGSSFALELMRKTGFDESHIVRVRSLSGEESGRTEDLLLELSEKQQDLDALLTENVKKQEQLDLLLNEYATLKDKIQGKRKDILDDARNKASELLKEANKQIELTIRTIREHGAQPEKTKQVREKLEQFREKAVKPKEKPQPAVPAAPKVVFTDYKPGMWVINMLNSTKGEVLEVKKDRVLAAFGLLKMWVPIQEIEPVVADTNKKHAKKVSGFDWVDRQASFSPNLDVRGALADEALRKVQVWLEEAYALGQSPLKIVHGRGDGILRKALREYFKKLNYVRSWHSEREENGGDGCTIVELM
jgi:DNA mismatch repair protein MutS2